MGTHFHYMAFFQYQDLVHLLDRGQPVGDNDGGPPFCYFFRSLLDELFGVGINGRGGLIQHQDAGVSHIGPEEGDQLPLSAGEHASPFLDVVLVPAWQAAYEFMHPDLPGRLLDVLLFDVRIAQGDVVGDGICKEENVLKHHGYIIPQGVEPVLRDIPTIQQDMARIDVVKTVEQVDDGGFSSPRGSHNGNLFAGSHLKGDPVQYFFVRFVGKTDLGEFDGPLHMPYLHGTCILNAAVCIQDLKDPAGGDHPHLQGVEFIGDLPQGAEKHFDQQDKGKQGSRDLIAHIGDVLQPAIPNHQPDGKGCDDFGHRKEKGVVPDRFQPGILVLFIDLPEFFSLDLLPGEELDDLHAGQAFLNKGIQVGNLGAYLRKGDFHSPLEQACCIQDHREDGKHQQGELPVQPDHDGRGHQHFQQVGHNHKEALGKDLPDAL